MDTSRILLVVIQLFNIVLLIINMNIFQINGKRGFANRRHLQETRVYQRNEQVLYAAPPEAQYYEAQLGGPGKGVKKYYAQCQNFVKTLECILLFKYIFYIKIASISFFAM